MVILVIATHGTKIGKHKELFSIKRPGTETPEELYPAEQIEEILIEANASISTAAIRLAANYSVPFLFISGNEPLALLVPFVAHGTVQLRREQIVAYNDQRGVKFVKAILHAASKNKIKVIKGLMRARNKSQDISMELNEVLNTMELLTERLKQINGEKIDDCRSQFFALEAEITKNYYYALKFLVGGELFYDGRTRKPPRDPVNALLSYGYAILTAQIHKAVIIAGLDPFAGFLHTDKSGKLSFVYDLIELFRQPVVDRLVLTIVNKRLFKPEDFSKENDAIRINDPAKKKYLQMLFERMRDMKVKYRGKETSFLKIFIDQARSVGKFFAEGREYEPYRM